MNESQDIIQENDNVEEIESNSNHQDIQQKIHTLEGKLMSFISPDELKWRKKLIYQQYPYQAFTQYVRNIPSQEKVIRTPKTLQQSIHYLISKILDLCDDLNFPSKETIGYLSNRFRAIRRQFHIQNVFNVDAYFKIVQVNIISSYYTQDSSELWTSLGTVFEHYLVNKEIQNEFDHQRKIKLVKYLLLVSIKYNDYQKILTQLNDQVRQIEEIQQIITLCNSIKLKRFHAFFQFLRRADFLDGCILNLYCNQMRQFAIRSFAKAQLNMQIEYLKQLLFFDSNESLLFYLQLLGYKTKEYSKKLSQNKDGNLFISLKLSQNEIKSLVKSLQLCKRIKSKQNGLKLSAIVMNQN